MDLKDCRLVEGDYGCGSIWRKYRVLVVGVLVFLRI